MFKNLLKNTLLTVTFTLFTTVSNAAFITQDLIFDDLNTANITYETIGSITVDTDKADANGIINSWEDFSLFGRNMITEDEANGDFTLFGLFAADVDSTNLNAGIEFLTFDVVESTDSFFNFQGLVDTATGNNFIFDVFDFNGGLYTFGNLALGNASVVSEPSMFLLFFSGLIVIFMKRRKA